MSERRVFTTHSEEQTAAVAAELAARLAPGTVVLLYGELGAGKTAFVRGLAAGLGLDADEVSSPTFTLIQEYRVPAGGAAPRVPALFHVDLYRLEGGETDDLGLEELTAGGGVAAVEWAEKLERPLPGAISVQIADAGDDSRKITVG